MRGFAWWIEAWRREFAVAAMIWSLREHGPSMNVALVQWWKTNDWSLPQ